MNKLYTEDMLEQHRHMWLWIAEIIKESCRTVAIPSAKRAYYDTHVNKNIYDLTDCSYCFLCELFSKECNVCKSFLRIDNSINGCLNGLYDRCCDACDWETQYSLAMKIANLTYYP